MFIGYFLLLHIGIIYKTVHCLSSILREEVEEVEDYRYLFFHLEKGLNWKCNTEAVYKKGHSRLYFFRKLRSFSVSARMLHIFYKVCGGE